MPNINELYSPGNHAHPPDGQVAAAENPALAAEQPGPDRCGGVIDSGAPPSNTAPSSCIGSGCVHVLHSGIDSLYTSYRGELSPQVEFKLQRLKEAAQSIAPMDQAESVYALGEHRFEVRKAGRGRFPFVLVDNAYRFELASCSSGSLPLALVQIRSKWLLSRGVSAVCDELHELISQLGNIDGCALISRVDICVDFTCDFALDEIGEDGWVSRAKRISKHSMDRNFTGWSIGLGGDISARLYDKSREVMETGKEYMHDVWRERGWDGEKTVWRLEFQYKRTFLKERGVTGVDSLLASLGPLWRYATQSWLRLSLPSNTDKTQSRWPLHPAWDALSQVPWDGSSGQPLPIPARAASIPSDQYIFENGLLGITSFMAINGITDPLDAFRRYHDGAKEYHTLNAEITGHEFPGYLRSRAALKAKRYNLPYPEIDERIEERLSDEWASPDDYRRARDGRSTL